MLAETSLSMSQSAGSLPVNEVFETIQGEANFAGTPAIFVRLQGCDVGCPWCDTKHTWDLDPTREITLNAMLAKETDTSSFAALGLATLVGTIGTFQSKHVVITGGEPCRYDLRPLTGALIEAGYRVQIETSGTEIIMAHDETWVTVSPKYNMPGGRPTLFAAYERANEIKLPVGKAADIETFLRAYAGGREAHPPKNRPQIWLQPLSASQKATDLCIAACRRYQWRLSVQTHKYIGVR